MLIAVDTSTRILSIALHDGDNVLSEQTWMTDNRHTIDLAPAVNAMLEACQVNMDDLIGMGVSIGPGSYTGLRIGVAFAKGLASPRNLPLVGVSTLDILAAGTPYYQTSAGLVAVVPAGRGRIIVRTYRWRKGSWGSRTDARIMEWDALLKSIDGPAIITGEIDSAGLRILREAISKGATVEIAPAAARLRRAGFLAELAWEKLHQAGGDLSEFSPKLLAPFYLKSDSSES